jgi:hypothetical protein
MIYWIAEIILMLFAVSKVFIGLCPADTQKARTALRACAGLF